MGFPQYWLRLSKFIQIPDPPKEPTRSNPKPTDPTTSAGRRRVFITKNQFHRVRLQFSSLKTQKTQTDRKISKFWLKNPNSSQNFLEFDDKTQIPMIFFHFSALFPLDPMRFWPDLAKSHRIRWDFCQIWQNLIESDEIFARSVFFPLFSRHPESDWLARHLLMFWTAWLDYSGRLAVGAFFLHLIPASRFQVGHKPDPDQPMDSPSTSNGWPIIKIWTFCGFEAPLFR